MDGGGGETQKNFFKNFFLFEKFFSFGTSPPPPPPTLMPFAIHGTYWKAWETIRNNGLKRMKGKANLCFQPGQIGNSSNLPELVAKFKNNCEVLVYIDLAKAIMNEIPFYKSANNVVVSPGDLNMRIPPRYFLKAVHISPTTGDQIWIESLGNDDAVDTSGFIAGLESSNEVGSGGVSHDRESHREKSFSESHHMMGGDDPNDRVQRGFAVPKFPGIWVGG